MGSLGVKGGPTLSPNSVAPTVKTPEMPAIIATIPPSILMTISRYLTLLPAPPPRHHAPTSKLGPSAVIRQEEQLNSEEALREPQPQVEGALWKLVPKATSL